MENKKLGAKMKVLLVNGSPHKNGCTYTALEEISKTLKEEEIESEIFQAGKGIVLPCMACYACQKKGKCIIEDEVNDFVNLAETFDGFIFGTPVHYASAASSIVSFLDRAFFSASKSGRSHVFKHKPGSVIASARRAGTTATIDQLLKYFTISQMPIISGRYWNMVHGNTPEEVKQDLEGMQNMRILAKNMAWHLKCREAAEKAGITPPKQEEIQYTNFIR